jgi:Phage terminase large subunit
MTQTINVRIPDKLTPIFTSTARYNVLYGGRASGKSHTVAQMLLVKAMEKPLRILCCREFQNSIRDSVHKLLSDYIAILNLPGFTITNDSIRHTNGSEFIFKGVKNNITSIKSLEGIDICAVEEAQTVSSESWETLIPTIRKEGSQFFIVFNPGREDDPTYQRFVVNPPEGSLVINVNYWDNPWLSPEIKEELNRDKSIDFKKYLHVWEGHPSVFFKGDPVYGETYFKPEIHVKDKPFIEGKEVLLSFDLGYGRPSFLCAQENDDQLIVLRENIGHGIQISSFIDEALSIVSRNVSNPRYWTTCDSVADSKNPVVETTQADIFRSKGLNPIIQYQKVAPGIDAVKNRLTTMAKNFEPKLVIHPSCKNLIEGLSGGYQLDTNGKPTKPSPYDDAQDSLRFLVVNRYGFIERRPITPFNYRKHL